jgi:polysaccharide export outer membrane protein
VRVENERITVPELIASVGGIPYSAKRDNILVIREIAGKRTYGYVDMTTAEVFENPFYYLRQNDIVYVEPTYKTVKSAGWITSFQGLISLGTTIFSLIILFTR